MISPDVTQRAGFLGGTAWGDILQAERWHCARRLYYDVTGAEPDFERHETPAMQRGKDCEPIILDKFEQRYACAINGNPSPAREDWLPGWWRGHLDGSAVNVGQRQGEGVVEAKSVNRHRWYAFQDGDGIPLAWRAQVLHYMPLIGARWGMLALFCADPDIWELACIDIERDDALLQKMLRAGNRFMARVAAKDPPDGRRDVCGDQGSPCRTCVHRLHCLGPGLVEEAEAAAPIVGRGELPMIGRHEELEAYVLARDTAKRERMDRDVITAEAESAIATILDGLGYPDGVRIEWPGMPQGRKVAHSERDGRVTTDLAGFAEKHPEAYVLLRRFQRCQKRYRQWDIGKAKEEKR